MLKNTKKTLYLVFGMALLLIIHSCNGLKPPRNLKKSIFDTLSVYNQYVYHLRILDSAVRTVPDTLIHCCSISVDFVEGVSKIEATSNRSFVGRMFFTKQDLEKWHKWFESNQKSLQK